jgi:hypothetical protein
MEIFHYSTTPLLHYSILKENSNHEGNKFTL